MDLHTLYAGKPTYLANDHNDLVDLMVDEVDLFSMVSVVVVGVGAIVGEPCQLGRVHECGNCQCWGYQGGGWSQPPS